ncbi:MAG: hypothetical protein A2W03_09780 [Candidatus Aminicenantes bacterium RBG_16_63_16]|nr:MAG: hypothetical protein A2W03_09780 [Candidatus Aminicenantes bacterium RBG_16_63_16]
MEIIHVGNLIVIKTRPGNAQTIAGAIDRTRVPGIIATIGGHDTILAITKDKPAAASVVKSLKKNSPDGLPGRRVVSHTPRWINQFALAEPGLFDELRGTYFQRNCPKRRHIVV